jgi:hypothetical protein
MRSLMFSPTVSGNPLSDKPTNEMVRRLIHLHGLVDRGGSF